MTKRTWIALACLLCILSVLPASPAQAQSSQELDLIAEINALRASRGLAPYTVDAGLMAMACGHSQDQASISKSTHEHSDGRMPPELGVVENVAGGDLGYITPQTAIYDIWMPSPGHALTLVGFETGSIGVGIADDGVTAYYTRELRPGASSSAEATPEVGDGGTATAYTPIALVPLETAAPRPDGTVVHVVGYGQTLWSIAVAYGVTVDQIRAWNNIADGSTEIYAGQALLVRPASLVTPFTPPLEATPAGWETPAVEVSATPTPGSQAQAVAMLQPTATQGADPGPDQPAGRAGLPVTVVLAAVAILAGLALRVLVLSRKPRF